MTPPPIDLPSPVTAACLAWPAARCCRRGRTRQARATRSWPRPFFLGAALSLLSAVALAHDTWFQVEPQTRPPALWLGTGERFPVQQSRVEFEHLRLHGCARQAELATRGAVAGRALTAIAGPAGRQPQALALRLPASAAREPVPEPTSCWASLVPFDLELEPARVAAYLDEIAAPDALRQAWAREQAAGRPWRERFVKHARAEIGGASSTPAGLALEAVVLRDGPVRLRESVEIALLHQGQPLADHPVELVNERSAVGLWRRTDGRGRIALALPLGGRWLLRSTLLRSPMAPNERWQSDFTTLTFSVEPPVATGPAPAAPR